MNEGILTRIVNEYCSVSRKNLTTCQQDVFAKGLVASLLTSYNNAIILSSCRKVVTHNC
jgi:hypothetical protein